METSEFIWIKESDSPIGMSAISHGKDFSEIDNHLPYSEIDSFFRGKNIFEILSEKLSSSFDELVTFMWQMGWEYVPEMCTSNGYVNAYAFRRM